MRSSFWMLLLVASACMNNQPLPPDQLAHFQACTQDSDCVMATNGCCCQSVFINKSKTSDFSRQFTCNSVCDCFALPACPKCSQGLCTSNGPIPDAGVCP